MRKVGIINELANEDAILTPLNAQTIFVILGEEAFVKVEVGSVFFGGEGVVLSIYSIPFFLAEHQLSEVDPSYFIAISFFLVGKG